jgi:hypothetical protein
MEDASVYARAAIANRLAERWLRSKSLARFSLGFAPGTLGLVSQSLELSTGPPDDIGIDPLQDGTQLRLVEVAVVAARHGSHVSGYRPILFEPYRSGHS